MKSMDVPIKFCKALLMLSLRGLGSAAQTNQTGARWIPTDLNYGVLTNLRENALQSPADQIAGAIRHMDGITTLMASPVLC